MPDSADLDFMQQAIEVSKMAPALPTCFRVGAVLVGGNGKLISKGYTLEFGVGWHAEAAAIKKALDAGVDINGASIYSSLEPCSVRKSGARDCSALLIEKGISKVFYALAEPPIFVICEGDNKLKAAGIKVEKMDGFDDLVREINAHLAINAK